jgi:uncharacterized Zn finger protein/ketosteroid isomerase-like protein
MPDPFVVPRLKPVRGAAARSATWWGTAFVRSVEESAYGASDLRAGRALARSGRLGAIMVLTSMASVVVDAAGASRDTDRLMAQVKVEPLTDWTAFVDEAARESGFVAALEAGQLPADLVEHADQAGAELLPATSDFETACECAAWTQPCPHVLALLYQLAWQIDRDPYVLMLLRGRTREWFVEEVAARHDAGTGRTVAPHQGPRVPLQDSMSRARQILTLSQEAPRGHGLADSAVAAYDEAVARLVDPAGAVEPSRNRPAGPPRPSEGAVMPASPEEIATAFSQHRFGSAYPHLAPDVRWELVGGDTLEGAEAVRRRCEGTLARLATTTTTEFDRFRTVTGTGTVVVDVAARYTDATGQVTRVSACDFYEFADGLVAAITSYTVTVSGDV